MGCAGRPVNGCSGYRMHRVTRSALSPVAVVTGRTRPAGWGAGECPRGRAAGGRAAGASRGTSCHLRTGVLPAQRRGRRGPSGRGAGRDFTLSRRARNAGEVAAACHSRTWTVLPRVREERHTLVIDDRGEDGRDDHEGNAASETIDSHAVLAGLVEDPALEPPAPFARLSRWFGLLGPRLGQDARTRSPAPYDRAMGGTPARSDR